MKKVFFVAVLGLSVFASAYVTFWYWIVRVFYKTNLQIQDLIVLSTIKGFNNNHQVISAGALVLTFTCGLLLVSLTSGSAGRGARVVRGRRLLSQSELYREAKNRCTKSPYIYLGGIPFPDYLHGYHTLINGPTGRGKTNAFFGLIQGIQERGERMIILDPDGDYYSRFAMPEDTLMNPFDKRTVYWDPFNDVKTELDADAMALALLPPLHIRSGEWDGNTRPLLGNVISACQKEGLGTFAELIRVFKLPEKELANFLGPYAPIGFFHDGALRALGSALFTLGTKFQNFRHVSSGDFSIEEWIETGKGNLYLTWNSKQLTVLSPYYTTLLEVILRSLMTEVQKRPTWLLIDELGQMGQLSSIEMAVTFGRKKGLCVVAGLQSNAQLKGVYGEYDAASILTNLSSTLILGAAHHDRAEAKLLAESFGQIEVLEPQYTSPTSTGGVGSMTVTRRTEQLVLPEEISSLPLGSGYLKFGTDLQAAKVKVPVYSPDVRRAAFIPNVPGEKWC